MITGPQSHLDRSSANRDGWDAESDQYQLVHGAKLAATAAAWGVWRVPEAELDALGDVEDQDVLELGCGGAQWSIELARRGARCTGLDLSGRQLEHARRLVAAADVTVPLVQGNGERTPFRDASFDLVFCDHGAMTFARPELAVAEAARLLRPGGRFVFCSSSPLREIAWDEEQEVVGDLLISDYFGLYDIDDDGVTCYQLPYGQWVRLFRANGLAIEDLIEIRPKADATTTYEDYVSLEWARRWPAECLWKLTREGGRP